MTQLSAKTLPALIDETRHAVETAGSFIEVKRIADRAEALRQYAKCIEAGLEAQNLCAEIKLRAERRMGQELSKLPRAKSGPKARVPSHDAREQPKLSEIGINYSQSSRWQKVGRLTEAEFDEYVETTKANGDEITSSGAIKLSDQIHKADDRAAKLSSLAKATERATDELGLQQYNIILADPPWRFEPRSRKTGMDRAADNHYPTMTIDDIEALDVAQASHEDCALFLWATAPMIHHALGVMTAWGFEYKSQMIWIKDRVGTGYWFRNLHEILLVGTRGKFPAPEPGQQTTSVLHFPVDAHSRKPSWPQEWIEDVWPDLPKLEMFAREARDGWDSWGNEADG